ncbi:hypothetical protein A7X87_08615 [Stenotrophomonas maltophilia]|uniref:hypothetical protein n=1 Tax=Stenotrophomonas maltophilia TaxID=40324 RepID=UPI000DAA5FD3|nr:hypothetical protein [Stenotrophomonas maltophilia]PZT06113.1 hypothetical protein A7X87_08615 [Stenotrophomonas maltophilia]
MRNDNKSLADVQPGGMVRLATVPYDRARDLIGDAYNAGTHGIGYSQQAMELHDAIIPAQPSQVAYHGYVDLKWLSGSIGEVAHRLSTYMPTGLAEWADRARDCRIAAQVLSELSAQPSPGGQGDALASLPLYRLADDANGNRRLHRDDTGSWVKLQDVERALAARQPVEFERTVPTRRRESAVELLLTLGFVWNNQRWEDRRQPVGVPAAWMHTHKATGRVEYGLSPMYDCDFNAVQWDSVALYAAPAQAVDLGAVRALLQRRIEQWRSHLPADPGAPGTLEIETKGEHDYNNDVRIYREGIAVMEEVLSKIDSQAVGNG